MPDQIAFLGRRSRRCRPVSRSAAASVRSRAPRGLATARSCRLVRTLFQGHLVGRQGALGMSPSSRARRCDREAAQGVVCSRPCSVRPVCLYRSGRLRRGVCLVSRWTRVRTPLRRRRGDSVDLAAAGRWPVDDRGGRVPCWCGGGCGRRRIPGSSCGRWTGRPLRSRLRRLRGRCASTAAGPDTARGRFRSPARGRPRGTSCGARWPAGRPWPTGGRGSGPAARGSPHAGRRGSSPAPTAGSTHSVQPSLPRPIGRGRDGCTVTRTCTAGRAAATARRR